MEEFRQKDAEKVQLITMFIWILLNSICFWVVLFPEKWWENDGQSILA